MRVVLSARPMHGLLAASRLPAPLSRTFLVRRGRQVPVQNHAGRRIGCGHPPQPAHRQGMLRSAQHMAPGCPEQGHM